MNHIFRLTFLTLVWLSSTAATATVMTTSDQLRGYPKFDVRTFEVATLEVPMFEITDPRQMPGFNLERLDQYQPPLKKTFLAKFLNRWRFVLLPVWLSPSVVQPPVPGTRPPVAVAEPAVLELMALGFGVLMLLRIRLSRINDAGQNPAS